MKRDNQPHTPQPSQQFLKSRLLALPRDLQCVRLFSGGWAKHPPFQTLCTKQLKGCGIHFLGHSFQSQFENREEKKIATLFAGEICETFVCPMSIRPLPHSNPSLKAVETKYGDGRAV